VVKDHKEMNFRECLITYATSDEALHEMMLAVNLVQVQASGMVLQSDKANRNKNIDT